MKPLVLLCEKCGRETANWEEFDGMKFCDIACILQHVIEKAEEYRERFFSTDSNKMDSAGYPDIIGEMVGKVVSERSMQAEIERVTENMRAYVDDPSTCPYCGSENINYIESLPPTISVKCFDCGNQFVEVWQLVGVDDEQVYDTIPYKQSNESEVDDELPNS